MRIAASCPPIKRAGRFPVSVCAYFMLGSLLTPGESSLPVGGHTLIQQREDRDSRSLGGLTVSRALGVKTHKLDGAWSSVVECLPNAAHPDFHTLNQKS